MAQTQSNNGIPAPDNSLEARIGRLRAKGMNTTADRLQAQLNAQPPATVHPTQPIQPVQVAPVQDINIITPKTGTIQPPNYTGGVNPNADAYQQISDANKSVINQSNAVQGVINDRTVQENLRQQENLIKENQQLQSDLVRPQMNQELADSQATLDSINLHKRIIDDNYAFINAGYNDLYAETKLATQDVQNYYDTRVRRREQEKQETIEQQQTYFNETARMSGYSLSDNASHFIAGKLLQFTGDYDRQTDSTYLEGTNELYQLRQERGNTLSDINTLAINY